MQGEDMRTKKFSVIGALLWVGAALLMMLAAVPWILPSRWLSTRLFIAQATAFPHVLGIALIIVGLLIAALALRRQRRGIAAAGGTWAVAGLVFVLVPGTWLASPAPATGNSGRELSIVTFNSLDTLSQAEFTKLTSGFDPDIVVLPEASEERVKEAVAGTSYEGQVHSTLADGYGPELRGGGIAPTTVALHSRIGAARPARGPGTTWGSVTLQFDDESLPLLAAVHPAPPVPGLMESWRRAA
ncbi:hypothetical protein BSZ39_10745 [Bowdeniella nasicola]|uniref:Uncharacterized protein n=1 Tax=Bowdeniella nasicola TaxID=208480 RepID=A0A1Q5PZZ6_9ACTO|nr:tripartite tricarboxylate transporter TctB family protein [Bowdeniella nasicola]OKL53203.1 hypothetical protein BSZ39_10745 [Bowdeniella nasicola]